MISLHHAQPRRLATTILLLMLATGCSTLRPAATEQPSFYSLDSVLSEARALTQTPATLPSKVPTLILSPPHAASGFNSQRIVFTRSAHKLEYYAHSEWVDTPARMVAPLIVAALGNSGAFRAVVLTPSAAAGDLRLDSEILRLQHDLNSTPSQVRFTLRAYLVDNTTRQVLAWHEFDETLAATSEDPYGAVVAANRAVENVMEQLARFCSEAAARWQPASVER